MRQKNVVYNFIIKLDSPISYLYNVFKMVNMKFKYKLIEYMINFMELFGYYFFAHRMREKLLGAD